MRKSVTLITPAASDPVTAEELVAWAKIDPNEDEDTLGLLISTATEAAEQYLNRSLINRTLKLTLDVPSSRFDAKLGDGVYDLPISILNGCIGSSIDLPRGPVSSITSVKTYDTSNAESTYSSDNYTLDSTGSRLLLDDTASWPSNLRNNAAVAITYVAGYGSAATAIPKAIRTGILIHAATLYEQRGQCSEDIPSSCSRLYSPYRVFGGRVA